MSRSVFFAVSLILGFVAAPAANAMTLHHSEDFLASLHRQSRIQAPRLHMAAGKTRIAHPSVLQDLGIIGGTASAMYNSFTNTLVLQPEMTIFDEAFSGVRLRTMPELHQTSGSYSSTNAGILFHELSHAEWDFYVEEKVETYDRELMKVMDLEVPKIARAAKLSSLQTFPLASEIFAYYREDLISAILNDTNEIKLASGLHPDTNACSKVTKRPEVLRNFSPSSLSYTDRAFLRFAYVNGKDVDLELAPESQKLINEALAKHARATLRFPENRIELLAILSQDRRLQAAVTACLSN